MGGGGGGEKRRNFPKQRLAEVWLARSPITTPLRASCDVSCSLNEIHHHKNSMTDLTRPGSLPCEELQSYPSSKRQEKAKFVLPRKSGKISVQQHNFLGDYAAQLYHFLGNNAAAAKFPSCEFPVTPGRVKVHTNKCEPKVCSVNRKLIFGFTFGLASSDGEATGDVEEDYGGTIVYMSINFFTPVTVGLLRLVPK